MSGAARDVAIDRAIRATVLQLLATRDACSSICPSEVARALDGDETGWRALMPRIRENAGRLVLEGRVQVTQRDRQVDIARASGPVRLRRGPRFASG